MSNRKRLLLGALALVVIALIGWSFRPQPVPAALATAERGPLAVVIREEGQTRVKDRFQVSAPVAGYAPRLTLEAGDPVSAGEALLRLEPTPSAALDPRSRAEAEAKVRRARAALRAAESRLEAAEAADELAAQELERLEPLYDKGTISRSTLDKARAERRQAAAELRSARYNVEVARQELNQAEALVKLHGAGDGEASLDAVPVKSPVDGRVLQVHHESAGIVQPGDPLVCVADPASLEVVVEVLSADAVRLESGMAVRFDRWGGDELLDGRVRTVEPGGFTKVSALGVEEQRVRVVADITSPFEQWQSLGDGYRVEARFIVWRGDDVLQVPDGAVFRHDDGWALFRVVDGVARLQPVKVGRRGEQSVQVLEGVTAGDTVIAHPDSDISDGVRVTPYSAVAVSR